MRSLTALNFFLIFLTTFAAFTSINAQNEVKAKTCTQNSDCEKPYESYHCDQGTCKCLGSVYTDEPGYPCLKLIKLTHKCELDEQCSYSDSLAECRNDVCTCRQGTIIKNDNECIDTQHLPTSFYIIPIIFVIAVLGGCVCCGVCIYCCCKKKKKEEEEKKDEDE